MSYYKRELDSVLNDGKLGEYPPTIKVYSQFGSTKWLSLNEESAKELIKWLNTNILKK